MELPKSIVHVLRARGRELGDTPALWSKRNGSYQPTSWREYASLVERTGRGLMTLGLKPGQAVGILGFNRIEWHLAAYGAMSAGGTPVGIYVTSSPEQIQYIVHHCEAPIVVVENLAQLEKVRAQRANLPHLKHVVLMEGRADDAVSFDDLLARADGTPREDLDARVAGLEPEGLATLIYTSGTTGPPKGVEITHKNVVWTAAYLTKCVGAPEGEILISYLPLSHIAEQLVSMHCGVWNRFEVYFAESLEKLPENLREVRPTLFFAVPRVWEKFKARLEDAIAQAPAQRKKLLARAQKVATAYHERAMVSEKPGPLVALQYAIFKRLVFSKLHARLGLERCKLFGTSAAPIGRDVLEFFRAIDVPLLETYGQSEVTGPTSVSIPGAARFGFLGRPMPGLTVRIAEDGEILVKGDNVCKGYHKEPAATAELLEGGWMHSGDVGEIDAQGYLRITDRKKDLIVTSGGKKAAPQELEKHLRAIFPVGNAVVVGESRNYLCALLTLDPDAAKRFARERGLPEDPGALVANPTLQAQLQQGVDALNGKLAKWETIKRFEILPSDFTVEGGELTPTLKIKRKVVAEKYRANIERMYEGD
ncbi:MAG: long-chain fatty acid--CoA ligase [Deltaproteobacteria bacterium]|nr:long-chain fatty acid--CoA ligase [Deltaproteobacteria bacterium]